jgi:hypothetical protein
MDKGYNIETTPYGEFKMRNRIPGVTNIEAEFGVPVVYIHPMSQEKIYCDSIMEASKVSGLYPAVVTECLHNRYKREEYNRLFILQYNDFTHSFKNGSNDIIWYDPTSKNKYDVRKHSDVMPSNMQLIEIWQRTHKVLEELKYTPDEIFENSPIVYIDTTGEDIEYDTIMEFADEYWLHPLHIMEAILGYGELNERFKCK